MKVNAMKYIKDRGCNFTGDKGNNWGSIYIGGDGTALGHDIMISHYRTESYIYGCGCVIGKVELSLLGGDF